MNPVQPSAKTPQLGYYRTPAIFGERLVFACAEDLWEVKASGGEAKRMVTGPGTKTRPAFSPDGRWLSYSSNESGSQEIHIVTSHGESARQLTFLGSVSRNLAWKNNEILFTSQAQLPFQSALWLFSSSPEHPHPKQIPWGPISAVSFHSSGACVIGRHEITEYSTRKRYRGGAAGELWIDGDGSGEFQSLITLSGNLTRPCWVGDRVYFLSDHEGFGNVYSCGPEGDGLQRHTEHRSFARSLATDGHTLVYSCDADIYRLTPGTPPKKLEIQCACAAPARQVSLAPFLEDFAYVAKSASLALVARGYGWLTSGEKLETGSTRLRLICRLDETRLLGVVSTGLAEQLAIYSTDGRSVTLETEDFGRAVGLKPSPDRKKVALANDRHELWIFDLTNGKSSCVDQSPFAEIAGFDWSPDGKSLAYALPLSADRGAVRIFDLASQRSKTLTAPGYRVSNPCFDHRRPYLYFLAERFFTTTASGTGNSLQVLSRPCSILLHTDVEDAQACISVLPLPQGNYLSLAAVSGKILYLRSTALSNKQNSQALYSFDFENESLVADDVSAFRTDDDQVCYRRRSQFFVSPSTQPLFDAKDTRIEVTSTTEWRQMFDEAWRGQRDHFWQAGEEENWHAIRTRHLELVDRVVTRAEFSDLLLEMLGEIETSHAYCGFNDRENSIPRTLGYLGADLYFNESKRGFEITRLLRDDLWDRETSSPLAQPELDLREGDVVLAVDGTALLDAAQPAPLLKAGVEARMTIGRSDSEKIVIVKPIPSEVSLRHADWVRRSQLHVTAKSNGRCGYLQIPNTHAGGYADFYRQFLAQASRPALIIDARYSSGGNTAEFILDRLARRSLGEIHSRWSETYDFPSACAPATMILLINEYTGSDSEVLAHSFRRMKLGPLIGKRTWGGVFGYKSRLIARDGGFTTRPQTAFFLEGVEGSIENHGVEPDISIEFRPQDYHNGTDPQLERALTEVIARLGGGELE